MASALYGKGREGFLAGNIDWDADAIKVVLVNTSTYTLSIDADDFLSDIITGDRIATSAAMGSKTVTLGVADAANFSFTSVTGVTSQYLVVYVESGGAATSRLIANIDSDATGLPIKPNGANIDVTWSGTTSRIFKL